MNRRHTLIASVLFTGALLALLLANVELEHVAASLAAVPFRFVLAGFALHLAAYVLRTVGFALFLERGAVAFRELLMVHFVHNFYLHMVPANIGEFSFPWLLRHRVPKARSLSILLLSRVSSMIASVLIFVVAALMVFDWRGRLQLRFGWTPIALVLGLALLVGLVQMRGRIAVQCGRYSLTRRLVQSLTALRASLRADLERLRLPRLALVFGASILAGMLAVIGYYAVILRGMGLDLSLLQVAFVSTLGLAFLVLPVKSLGGFGATEGAWTIGLMLLGVEKEVAISAGFVVHIYSLANVCLLFVVGTLGLRVLRVQ